MRDRGEWERVIFETFWRGEKEENPLGNVEKNHAAKPDVTGSNRNGFKGCCPTGGRLYRRRGKRRSHWVVLYITLSGPRRSHRSPPSPHEGPAVQGATALMDPTKDRVQSPKKSHEIPNP